jgi:hypothetical protein
LNFLSAQFLVSAIFYQRTASTNGNVTLVIAARRAVALWMNPPPSTRAWPEAAS